MRTVIEVENLSKKFRIGKLRQDAGTLRDLIGNIIKLPFSPRRAAKRLENNDSETLWALKNVDFKVYQGDMLGIVGGNGAGKSTLLKILSRIIKPTTGKARLAGRVGSLLEVGTGFHQDLTGRENVFLNGAVLGMPRRDIARKFDDIVAFAELEKFIDTPVKFYSTGMYMRLGFAVAAYLEPDILIVDEVLAVGDAAFQAKCLTKMNEAVGDGRTILLVSHSAGVIEELCKTVLYLKNGNVAGYGEMKPVLDKYKADYEPLEAVRADSRKLSEIVDGEVRFIEWKILNPAQDKPHAIVSRETAELEFQLVSKCRTANVRFNFAVQDQNGNQLIAASSVSARETAANNLDANVYRVNWSCSLPFKAGLYQLVVEAVASDETLLDRWSCEPELEILPSPENLDEAESSGLINVPVRFRPII